jgi:hypothetical protein
MQAYLNGGQDKAAVNAWKWTPIGSIATGLGPGANVRFADIDGDGVSHIHFIFSVPLLRS